MKNLSPIDEAKDTVTREYVDTKYPLYTKYITTDIMTQFRTETKGDTATGHYITMARNQDAAIEGCARYSATLAWGSYDTHSFLAPSYSSARAYLGAGNSNKLNWFKELAFMDSNVASATKLANPVTIDGVSFDGSADITHYGTCSTAAATAEKVVTLPNFTLVTGAKITVRFTITNTADNVTLNVNGTGAKPVYYSNGAATARLLKLNANILMDFIYDGTNWVYDGQMSWTSQSNTTVNEERRLLLSTTADDEQDRGALSKSAKFTANPSTGVLTAPYLKSSNSGTLLHSGAVGSSSKDITIANLSQYTSVSITCDGNGDSGLKFAISNVIPIAYLAKSTSNTYKIAGGIVSEACITSDGPIAKHLAGYITASMPSGTVLRLAISVGIIGNVSLISN